MNDFRNRRPAGPGPHLSAAIPAEQSRALDRRHALDEQQRAYRNDMPRPYFSRPRPPA